MNFDVIVVFPFGINDELLADETSKYSKPKAIFTTGDLSNFFFCYSGVLIAEEKENERLSTLGFVRQFAELAKEKKWNRILIVAAPPHLYRATRDMRKVLGKEIQIEGVKPSLKCRWFKNRRKAIRWWCREMILRLMPFKLYQKVVS